MGRKSWDYLKKGYSKKKTESKNFTAQDHKQLFCWIVPKQLQKKCVWRRVSIMSTVWCSRRNSDTYCCRMSQSNIGGVQTGAET